MTLAELCKEVLELDKQATKGPWAVAAGDSMLETSYPTTSGLQETITIGYPGRRDNSEFIVHARNNYAKLALAAQRMEVALIGLKHLELHMSHVGSVYNPSLGSDEVIHKTDYKGCPAAAEALADVQKIVEEGSPLAAGGDAVKKDTPPRAPKDKLFANGKWYVLQERLPNQDVYRFTCVEGLSIYRTHFELMKLEGE